MKLNKLKKIYDKEFGFDIGQKTNSRETAYARKVFYYTARQLGNTYYQIRDVLGQNHATVLHAVNTVDAVLPFHKKKYNKIALENNLDVELFDDEVNTMIKTKRQTQNEAILSKFNELSQLSDSEIKEFEETRLKPFLLMLKSRRKQKEIKNVVGARLLR